METQTIDELDRVKVIHGEDLDGGATAMLRLTADAIGGVHGVSGLRRVQHEQSLLLPLHCSLRDRNQQPGPHVSGYIWILLVFCSVGLELRWLVLLGWIGDNAAH